MSYLRPLGVLQELALILDEHKKMHSVFLIGAGFSIGANGLVSPNERAGAAYPVASDMGKCFGGQYNLSLGVEQAFLTALGFRDHGPGKALIDLIQSADHYIGSRVAAMRDSPYHNLVRLHPDATFLSFNYDCLLEQLLFNKHLWNPEDGFGVTTKMNLHPRAAENDTIARSSRIRVLHLHGSLYAYPVEFETYKRSDCDLLLLCERNSLEFRFDPDALERAFYPFKRIPPDIHYRLPYERIVFPIPDKSEKLEQRALKLVYDIAQKCIEAAGEVITIGYSFAKYDELSYRPLLSTLAQTSKCQLTVVDPNASIIAAHLEGEFPQLKIVPVSIGFADWIEQSTDRNLKKPSNQRLKATR